MEHNRLGLDFTILDVYFVAAQYNWNVLAHPRQIAMPIGHILVGDARSDVKHDNSALAYLNDIS